MTVIMEEGWWNAQTAGVPRLAPSAKFAGRAYRSACSRRLSSNLCPVRIIPSRTGIFGTVYLNLSSNPFAFPQAGGIASCWVTGHKPEVLEWRSTFPCWHGPGGGACACQPEAVSYLRQGEYPARPSIAGVPCPVDLYGSTEAGYLLSAGVQGQFAGDQQRVRRTRAVAAVSTRSANSGPAGSSPADCQTFRLCDDARSGGDAALRYTGDIVRRFPTGSVARAGGHVLFQADGTLVSPTDIDAALPEDFACWRRSCRRAKRWDFTTWRTMLRSTATGDGARADVGQRRAGERFPAEVHHRRRAGKFALLKPLTK